MSSQCEEAERMIDGRRRNLTESRQTLQYTSVSRPLNDKVPPGGQGRRTQAKVPGCSVLSLTDGAKVRRRRSKFDLVRRQQVATIRRLGACLRCRTLKISVCYPLLYLGSPRAKGLDKVLTDISV